MHIVVPNDWNDAFALSPEMDALRLRENVSIHKLPGAEMERSLADADIVVGIRERTRFEADRLAKMPKLKLIAHIGGRETPHIDVPGATARGVLISHTTSGADLRAASGAPGGMVELTIGMMISGLREFGQQDRAIRAGGWPDHPGRTLVGKTLGIVGLGRIGVGVAKAAQFFGMNVIAAGRTLTPERAAAAGVGFASLDMLFAESDIVSVHLKLTEGTRGMITRSLLNRMKGDAIFVNTSRGPVVDEEALFDVLSQRSIGGAALDVYDEEPLPGGHRLRGCSNTLLLGHCGWATQEAYVHMVPSIVGVITAFLDGAPINMVNPEALGVH